MKLINNLSIITLSIITLFMISCNDDNDDESLNKGSAQVRVTDAAVDAENITGVFLSVSSIQAGAENETRTLVTFEEPVTFNVMDYQNGETFDLGEGELEVGNYHELRLILTDGSPSSENSSSYIQFENGDTEALDIPSGTTSGYKITGDFQISGSDKTDLIVDIDLRKALVETGTQQYMLRPTARLIVDESLGVISGNVEDFTYDPNTKWVIYAYAEGTFDESETEEPVAGESRFENSVNSAVVADDGSYKLSFMEEGDYELIAGKYEKNETEGTYEFSGVVETQMMLGTDILNLVTVEAGASISVDLVILMSN